MNGGSRSFLALALASLLGACALHAQLALQRGAPGTWHAMVHVLLMGWATGMILAVLHHVMPVFTGRDFPHPWLPPLNAAVLAAGVAAVAAGWIADVPVAQVAGLGLEAAAAALFLASLTLLVERGTPRPHRARLPQVEGQDAMDRAGGRATRLAMACWPLGVGLLLAQQAGLVGGAWMLPAEHVIALGWILLTICGVAYHVLPRFSGRPARGATWANVQVATHATGLALMALGLGLGRPVLLATGGPLIAASLALFAWTIWPTLVVVDGRPRPVGIGLPKVTP